MPYLSNVAQRELKYNFKGSWVDKQVKNESDKLK